MLLEVVVRFRLNVISVVTSLCRIGEGRGVEGLVPVISVWLLLLLETREFARRGREGGTKSRRGKKGAAGGRVVEKGEGPREQEVVVVGVIVVGQEELEVVVVGVIMVVVVVVVVVLAVLPMFDKRWEYQPLGEYRSLPKTAEQYIATRHSDRM